MPSSKVATALIFDCGKALLSQYDSAMVNRNYPMTNFTSDFSYCHVAIKELLYTKFVY